MKVMKRTRQGLEIAEMTMMKRSKPVSEILKSGVVRWFNGIKGYGFVSPDDGTADVFIHVSCLEKAGMLALTEGQRVRFDTDTDRRIGKPKISNIELEP